MREQLKTKFPFYVFLLFLGIGVAFTFRVTGCGEQQLVQQETASPQPSSQPSTPPTNGCGKVTFAEVKPILAAKCLSCHDHATFDQYAVAKVQGPAMVKRVNLNENDPQRMPKDPKPALPQNEKDLFTKWQADGFLEICPQATKPPKTFYNLDAISTALLDKANSLSQDDRNDSFFLVATHKVDQGALENDLNTFFAAAHKAANSLNTQNSRLQKLDQFGPANSLFRLSLRDLGLNNQDLAAIIQADAFKIVDNTNKGQQLQILLNSRVTFMHFDNFIANTLGNPKVYYKLTRLAGLNFNQILQKLGVNFIGDQQNFTANFLGTSHSPISDLKPRLVTQFRSNDGVFWNTFDPNPLENVVNRNLFNAPLLIDTKHPFEFAAGESIFTLRNGLSGYILTNAQGQLLNEADPKVVRDVNSPISSIISNSLSCFRCHAAGVIPAVDEIRAHVIANASNFQDVFNGITDASRVQALYHEQPVMDKAFKDYNDNYQRAIGVLGASPQLDPVTFATDRFQLNWDINQVASFLFLSQDDFKNALNQSAVGKQQLGSLLTGGVVSLDQLKQALPQVIKDARLFEEPLGK